MYNSCIAIWKIGRTTKCKFLAWKVAVEEMVCKIWLSQKGKQSFANECWTEAETKSDSQVVSLMNVAEFKVNSMD